jgi:hypothetical protein
VVLLSVSDIICNNSKNVLVISVLLPQMVILGDSANVINILPFNMLKILFSICLIFYTNIRLTNYGENTSKIGW